MVESIKELKSLCRKPSNMGTAWIAKVFVRKFSIYLTWLLLHTSITANQVTILMLIFQLVGICFIFIEGLGHMLIGLLILIFSFVLDAVDGEIARYRKTKTLLGNHLDIIEHHVTRPLMYFGIGFNIFRMTGIESALIFGILCAVFSNSVIITAMNYALVNMRLCELRKVKAFKLNNHKGSINLIKREGEIPNNFNILYKISEKIKVLWTTPYEYFYFLLAVTFYPPLIYYLLMVYTVFFVSIQITSFIINIKSNTIKSYYYTLFKQ